MPEIHPSAILEGDVDLAPDASVGPGCVLRGPLTVGAGTRLLGHVHLQGPLELGAGNLVYPFACLGFAPQSVGADVAKPGRGLRIGDRNVFREGATVHRALTDAGPTRIGSDCFLMVNSHVGHDAWLDDEVVLANGALVGGHARLGERTFAGGNSAVHQYVRVGRGAMLSGCAALSRDLPPFFTLTGLNLAGSVNLVGMRRSGMPRAEIDDVRWCYRTLYRRKLTPRQAVEALSERAERPRVAEILEFVRTSERGICSGSPSLRRRQADPGDAGDAGDEL